MPMTAATSFSTQKISHVNGLNSVTIRITGEKSKKMTPQHSSISTNPNGESNLPTNNQNIIDMKKIEVGMRVYCDIHSQSKEHVVTHVSEERGFAGIDNEYWWPIDQCFPCDEVTLPKKRS